MRRAQILAGLAASGLLAQIAPVHAAATGDQVAAALARAEASEAEAGRVRNQWTSTEAELASTRKAEASGDHDKALGGAELADAMAQRSIAQAREQGAAWPEAVVR